MEVPPTEFCQLLVVLCSLLERVVGFLDRRLHRLVSGHLNTHHTVSATLGTVVDHSQRLVHEFLGQLQCPQKPVHLPDREPKQSAYCVHQAPQCGAAGIAWVRNLGQCLYELGVACVDARYKFFKAGAKVLREATLLLKGGAYLVVQVLDVGSDSANGCVLVLQAVGQLVHGYGVGQFMCQHPPRLVRLEL